MICFCYSPIKSEKIMRICWLCRKLLRPNQKSLLTQMKSIFCSSRKLSDTPKPSKEVAKHYKSIILNTSFEQNDTETLMTLDKIFSNMNKKRVQAKMGDIKTTPRTDLENVKDRRAAVLVPLCYVEREPSFLFMVRSIYLKNHRGEIR